MRTLSYFVFVMFVLVLVHQPICAANKTRSSPLEQYHLRGVQTNIGDILSSGSGTEGKGDFELRQFTSDRGFPLLLLPLLATPFIPLPLAPLFIFGTAVSLFVYQFGSMQNWQKLFELVASVLSPQPEFFVQRQFGNMSAGNGSGPGRVGGSIGNLELFRYYTSIDGLNGIKERTLQHFGLNDQVCQLRMVCESASLLSMRVPPSFLNVVRSGTGFVFANWPQNQFLSAWIIGLTGSDCSTSYAKCQQSPLRRLFR